MLIRLEYAPSTDVVATKPLTNQNDFFFLCFIKCQSFYSYGSQWNYDFHKILSINITNIRYKKKKKTEGKKIKTNWNSINTRMSMCFKKNPLNWNFYFHANGSICKDSFNKTLNNSLLWTFPCIWKILKFWISFPNDGRKSLKNASKFCI